MRLLFLICLFVSASLSAQIRKVRVQMKPPVINKEKLSPPRKAIQAIYIKRILEAPKWKKHHSFGANLNEMAFSNWKSGGQSSFSVMTDAKIVRRYIATNYFWDNELLLNYGVNIQQGEKFKKMDDKLSLNSTFGYRAEGFENWYYSAKIAFNTQMTNGYNYPNREQAISKFFAPAYLYTGLGGEYANTDIQLRFFVSPLTLKSTLVLSEELANRGAFGVKPARYDAQNNLISKGKRSLTEVGMLLLGEWEKTLWENIDMTHRVSLYTDYIHHFGNIDLDWEVMLSMKVNKYVKARLGVHLKYDDDVKFYERTDAFGNVKAYGARLQFKQLLGVGVQYSF